MSGAHFGESVDEVLGITRPRSSIERLAHLEGRMDAIERLLGPAPDADLPDGIGETIAQFIENQDATMLEQQSLMGADMSLSPTQRMLRLLAELARALDA